MRNILSIFPEREILKIDFKDDDKVLNVNAHIHTPYSFSAFEDISQAYRLSKKENIDILGINDFISTKGYKEFHDNAIKYKVFPLFNVEFMCLLKEEQANNIRINDPDNPGRAYFCGKGLNYDPYSIEEKNDRLKEVFNQSIVQTRLMTEKVNSLLSKINSPFYLSFEEIQNKYSKGLVRERHIAKVIRIKIFREFSDLKSRKEFLKKLYSGKDSEINSNEVIPLENEIRSKLLKKGGKAFVPENEKAFLAFEEAREIIIEKGGIPCYPVLLDFNNDNFTEIEKDYEALYQKLIDNNIPAIELIPARNQIKHVREFVNFFWNKNFLILFGTEHNSSEMVPLFIAAKDAELDEELKKVSFESACIIAAHQYLHSNNKEGYINKNGKAKVDEFNDFVLLGKMVLAKFFQI